MPGDEVEGDDHAGAAEAAFAVDEGGESLGEERVDAGEGFVALFRRAGGEVLDGHGGDVEPELMGAAGVVGGEGIEGYQGADALLAVEPVEAVGGVGGAGEASFQNPVEATVFDHGSRLQGVAGHKAFRRRDPESGG